MYLFHVLLTPVFPALVTTKSVPDSLNVYGAPPMSLVQRDKQVESLSS